MDDAMLDVNDMTMEIAALEFGDIGLFGGNNRVNV
jgi:hypothetical protein